MYMCGVIVILGHIGIKEETIFKQMLEVGVLRGRDSTGVIKVNEKGVVETRKKAVHGADFVKLESKWIEAGMNRVLIGHNRWATKGAVTDVNAHPFSCGKIHGVHNGTLERYYTLTDHTKFAVDSEALMHNINLYGLDHVLPLLSGAFTVPYYDEEAKLFTMFKNDQRELALCTSKDGRTVYMASEYTMLHWVLERNGVDVERLIDLKPNIKLTYDPFDVSIQNTMKLTTDLQFAPKYTNWTTVNTIKNNTITLADKVVAFNKKKVGCEFDLSDEDIDAPFDLDNFFDKLDEVVCEDSYNLPMTRREWRTTKAYSLGCCCCGMDIVPDGTHEFVWHEDGTNAYCPDCVEFIDMV